MRINVTRKHIRKGMPHSAHSCPVALAIHGNVPEDFIAVTYNGIMIGESLWDCKEYDLPQEVLNFIRKFDKSYYITRLFMKPFSFELDI